MSKVCFRRLKPRSLVAAFVMTVMLGGTACSDAVDPTASATLDVGTEAGVMNYGYALLQLEVDFDTRVKNNPFPGMLVAEASTFSGFGGFLAEVTAQRNSVPTLVPAGRITDALFFALDTLVNYSNRTSTLTSAQAIMEAEAQGMTGAIPLLTTQALVDTMTVWASSATSRANRVRTMLGLGPLSVTPLTPVQVIATLAPYYRTTLTVTSR